MASQKLRDGTVRFFTTLILLIEKPGLIANRPFECGEQLEKGMTDLGMILDYLLPLTQP